MSQKGAYPYDLSNSGDLGFSRVGLERNGGNLFSGDFNSSYPGLVRKVQSDFGWDKGIALVPCGIWGNIRLVKDGKRAKLSQTSTKLWSFLNLFFQRHISGHGRDNGCGP